MVEVRHCEVCGQRLPVEFLAADKRVCRNCGTPIDGEEIAPDQAESQGRAMPRRRRNGKRGKRKLPVALGVPMAAGLAVGVGAVLVLARREPPRNGPSARHERRSSTQDRRSSPVPPRRNGSRHGEVESPRGSDAPASMPTRSGDAPRGTTRERGDIERRASDAALTVPAVQVAVEERRGSLTPPPRESLEPTGRDLKAEEELFADIRRKSDERAAARARGRTKQRMSEPASAPAAGFAVKSFTLIDADTDEPLAGFDPLPDGATLDLAKLPTRKLNIRANTDPAEVGSVAFRLNGKEKLKEDFGPYALAGDTEGDYKPWTPRLRTHTLTATPYAAARARGKAGKECTIRFSVIDTKGGRR